MGSEKPTVYRMDVDTGHTGDSDDDNPFIQYSRERIRMMKHKNDVCKTNMDSPRSEAVKDLSLSDVIAERNILVPKRDRDNFGDKVGISSDKISLDEVIRRREHEKKILEELDKSLDEIVTERDKDTVGQKRKYDEYEKQMEMETSMAYRYIPTPMEAISYLTVNEGLIFEKECSRLGEGIQGRQHNWRFKVTCGQISVVVEAQFKDLARQGAAFELLKMLKQVYPGTRYPFCRMPDGCFFDPWIPKKFAEAAESLGIVETKFETAMIRRFGKDYYISTYLINGEDEFQAQGFFMDHTKMFAAKEAYETYGKARFNKQNYTVGEKCMPEENFKRKESDALHAMSIAKLLDEHMESGKAAIPLAGIPVKVKLPASEPSEEEELLVDESGRLYAKCGSNKIRRLMKLSDLCPDQVIDNSKLLAKAPIRLTGVVNNRFPTLEEDDEDELE